MSKRTKNEGLPPTTDEGRLNWSPELEERLRRAEEEVRRTGKGAPVFPELVVEDEEDDDVQQPAEDEWLPQWPPRGGNRSS